MNESTYEIITYSDGRTAILRTDTDGKVWSIPTDPANSDYQAYLASLQEHSTES